MKENTSSIAGRFTPAESSRTPGDVGAIAKNPPRVTIELRTSSEEKCFDDTQTLPLHRLEEMPFWGAHANGSYDGKCSGASAVSVRAVSSRSDVLPRQSIEVVGVLEKSGTLVGKLRCGRSPGAESEWIVACQQRHRADDDSLQRQSRSAMKQTRQVKKQRQKGKSARAEGGGAS